MENTRVFSKAAPLEPPVEQLAFQFAAQVAPVRADVHEQVAGRRGRRVHRADDLAERVQLRRAGCAGDDIPHGAADADGAFAREHAEDLGLQEKCVELMCDLEAESPQVAAAKAADYAEKHRAIIARFGRFPHRNDILGRESTLEEIEFLQEPGSSF